MKSAADTNVSTGGLGTHEQFKRFAQGHLVVNHEDQRHAVRAGDVDCGCYVRQAHCVLSKRAGWSPPAQFVNQTWYRTAHLRAQATVDGVQQRPDRAHRYEGVVDTFV
jgi:hypothetical protein